MPGTRPAPAATSASSSRARIEQPAANDRRSRCQSVSRPRRGRPRGRRPLLPRDRPRRRPLLLRAGPDRPGTGKLVEDGPGRPDDPLPREPRGRLRRRRHDARQGADGQRLHDRPRRRARRSTRPTARSWPRSTRRPPARAMVGVAALPLGADGRDRRRRRARLTAVTR